MKHQSHLSHIAARRLALRFLSVLLLPLILLPLCASRTHVAAQQASPASTEKPKVSPSSETKQQGANAASGNAKDNQRSERLSGQVFGEDGQPIAGASVTLFLKNSSGASRPQNTLTDENGKFRFENLARGIYNINAFVPGYVADTSARVSGSPHNYRPGDFADIRLTKGGVITGKVTNANGEAVVAAPVRAFLVRELDGQALPPGVFTFPAVERPTDDRGVYRLFGLRPGIYLVATGGNAQLINGNPGAYDGDTPTYFPSTTRDAASEISVRAGQEASGIDIRYRDERGHTVSGTVSLPNATQSNDSGIVVTLAYATGSGIAATTGAVGGEAGARPFIFEGLADGEYDMQARQFSRDGIGGISAPQRINIHNANITGLKITLTAVASISGHLIVEPPPVGDAAERIKATCGEQQARVQTFAPQETLIIARRDVPETKAATTASNQPRSFAPQRPDSTPDASGDFTISVLEAGRYRLEARPLDESFYVRAIELPAASQTSAQTAAQSATQPRATPKTVNRASPTPVAHTTAPPASATNANSQTREWLDVAPGQKLSGITLHLAPNAASVSGRVALAEGAQTSFTLLRVHLVPADSAQADAPLRFAEATPASDGTFTFTQLAPGRYRLIVRAVTTSNITAASRDASGTTTTHPVAWDDAGRAQLRREAEATGVALELQPCARASDVVLRFPSLVNK